MNKIVTNHNEMCARAEEALFAVLDPEMGISVIDLGLIYQLDFDESSRHIFCRMTLTTSFCPLGDAITHRVKLALEETFEGFEAEIILSFDPPWNPDRISDAGKLILHR